MESISFDQAKTDYEAIYTSLRQAKIEILWVVAVRVLHGCRQHIHEPESIQFVENALFEVLKLFLGQNPEKLSLTLAHNVEGMLLDAVTIVLSVPPEVFLKIVNILDLILSHESSVAFYNAKKRNSYYNNYSEVGPSPQVRTRIAKIFNEGGGFELVLTRIMSCPAPTCGLRLFFHIFYGLNECGDAVSTATRDALVTAMMEYLLEMTDEQVKNEGTEILPRLLACISSLSSIELFYAFRLNFTLKLLRSQVFVLKLFAWDQVSELLRDASFLRPMAAAYQLDNAGLLFVNGIYKFSHVFPTLSPPECGLYIREPTAEGEPPVTLFRCLMKSGEMWWFLSKADNPPGTLKDVDFYQHRNKDSMCREPPLSGWETAQAGQVSPPTLTRIEHVPQEGETPQFNLTEMVLQWALESNLLEHGFGPSYIKSETISRAHKLCKFLAEMKAMTADHLQLLWRAAIGNQDIIITEGVFSLLSILSPLLAEETFVALTRFALETLSQDGSQQAVSKVAVFIEKLVAEVPTLTSTLPDQSSANLLAVVWGIYKSPHFVLLKNGAIVQELLSKCLGRDKTGGETIERIKECIRYLVSSAQSQLSETAGGHVINTLLFLVSKQTGLSVIDASLQESFSSCLEAEIERFVEKNRARLTAGKVDEKWYSTQLAARLQVLRQFFGIALNVKMPLRLVDKLWLHLSSIPRELDELLNLFMKGVEEHAHLLDSIFEESDAVVIFSKYLCSKAIEWSTCSGVAFECFNAFFALAPRHSEVHEAGLETLWRVALSIQSEIATKQSIDLLLKTYEDKSLYDPSFTGSVLEVSFERLQASRIEATGSGGLLSTEQQLCVSRCVELLSCAISRFRGPTSMTAHAVCGTLSRIIITITYKKMKQYLVNNYNSNFTQFAEKGSEGEMRLSLHPLMTLHQLKEKICRFAKFPDVNSTTIEDSTKSLGKLAPSTRICETDLVDGCEISAVFTIRSNNTYGSHTSSANLTPPRPPLPIDDTPTTKQNVGLAISNDDAQFNCLIALCAAVKEPSVLSKIWNLLMIIPTSTEKEMFVREACDRFFIEFQGRQPQPRQVDWDRLLGSSAPEMTYVLQVVDHLMNPSEESAVEDSQEYSERLKKMFLHSGGFAKLLRILGSTSVGENEIEMVALSTALHVLHYLLFKTDESIFPPTSLFTELEASSAVIVEKLLAVASYAARAENTGVVQEAFAVLKFLLSKSPDAAAQLIQNPQSKPLLAFCLRSSSSNVRKISSDFAIFVGKSKEVIFSWLVAEIENIDSDDELCEDTFRALCVLLKNLGETPGAIDIPRLANFLSTRVLEFGPNSNKIESSSGIDASNNLLLPLLGYLSLLEILVQQHHPIVAKTELGSRLVRTFFHDFLFALQTAESNRLPVCSTDATRLMAFSILAAFVAKQPESLGEVLMDLSQLKRAGARQLAKAWNQQVSGEVKKSAIAYSGLKNQGCTCYINSLLQQLYMCSPFREAILSAPIRNKHRSTLTHFAPEDLVGMKFRVETGQEVVLTAYDSTSGEHKFDLCNSDGTRTENQSSIHLQENFGISCKGLRIVWTTTDGEEEQPLSQAEDAAMRVLEQLQRTFSYMKHSNRRFFDPISFVEACKCLNMNFNVFQQNDVAEFYDQLLDRLEISTKGTLTGRDIWNDVLQREVFGLNMVYQKIPKDCPAFETNKKECGHWQSLRSEKQLIIQVQVAGKDTLEETLSDYFVDEHMEGDNAIQCDVCSQKKDTIRRMSLGDPPNTLIIHLKRFTLDFQTFETVKINSRLEFPARINILKYTKEGAEAEERSQAAAATTSSDQLRDSAPASITIPTTPPRRGNEASSAGASSTGGGGKDMRSNSIQYDGEDGYVAPDPADYEYELQGVVVHSGIAQGGHYYSFSRDPEDPERWYKLEDDEVTPFHPSPENIAYQCFGGPASFSPSAATNSSLSSDEDRASNALILLYSKCIPRKQQSSNSTASPSPSATSASTGSPDSPSIPVMTSFETTDLEVEEEKGQGQGQGQGMRKGGDGQLQIATQAQVEEDYGAVSPRSGQRLVDGNEAFLREVRQSNLQHVLLQYVFDQRLHTFVYKLLSSALATEAQPDRRGQLFTMVRFAGEFLFEIVLHFRDRDRKEMKLWLRLLSHVFAKCPEGAMFFVANERERWHRTFLLMCPDSSARKFYADVQVAAVTSIVRRITLNPQADVLAELEAAMISYLDKVVVRFTTSAVAEPKYFDEAVMMIRDMAKLPHLRVLMNKARFITRLAFFIDPGVATDMRTHLEEKGKTILGRDDYAHLTQSCFEAIATLFGCPQIRGVSLIVEPIKYNSYSYSSGSTFDPVELSPECIDAFTTIFNESASHADGMTVLDLETYFERVGQKDLHSDFLKKHSMQVDADDVACLTLDAFIAFQSDKADLKTLWQDLRAFGFQNDLTRVSSGSDEDELVDRLTSTELDDSNDGIPTDCKKACLYLSFFEVGYMFSESSVIAIASSLFRKQLEFSKLILTRALERLLQRITNDVGYSNNNSFGINHLISFIINLLSINDEFALARMITTMNTDTVGLFEVVKSQLENPQRYSYFNSVKTKYMDFLSAINMNDVLRPNFQAVAEGNDEMSRVKRALRFDQSSMLTEDDDDKIRKAVVVLEGAYVSEADGTYAFADIFNDAGLYRRRGTRNGEEVDFSIYRCKAANYLQWFISCNKIGVMPGSAEDEDFYWGHSSLDDDKTFGRIFPPRDFISLNKEISTSPPPTIRVEFPTGAAELDVSASGSFDTTAFESDDSDDGLQTSQGLGDYGLGDFDESFESGRYSS